MGLIKVRSWVMTLISLLVVPSLQKIYSQLKEKADATPETWDDVLAGAFKTVIDFLGSPEAFEEDPK